MSQQIMGVVLTKAGKYLSVVSGDGMVFHQLDALKQRNLCEKPR